MLCNNWQIVHRRSPSKGTLISKSQTFQCNIKYSSDTLSMYVLMSLRLLKIHFGLSKIQVKFLIN